MQDNEDKALIDLRNAWNMLCPEDDKGFVSKLLVEMVEDGTTNRREQCRVIVGRLYDGLAYGNWPSAL